MAEIFLALGSNVGDGKKNIETAIALLSEKVSNIQRASLYVSKPMYRADQPDFINTAVSGATELSPQELLAFTQGIENTLGRVRRFPNGPREIDIDILLYEDAILDTPALAIPHARMAERAFVLAPLAEIAPTCIHPVLKKTMQTLLAELPESARGEVQLLP